MVSAQKQWGCLDDDDDSESRQEARGMGQVAED